MRFSSLSVPPVPPVRGRFSLSLFHSFFYYMLNKAPRRAGLPDRVLAAPTPILSLRGLFISVPPDSLALSDSSTITQPNTESHSLHPSCPSLVALGSRRCGVHARTLEGNRQLCVQGHMQSAYECTSRPWHSPSVYIPEVPITSRPTRDRDNFNEN